MALYAFDGTWNSAKDNEDKDLTDTNVVRFYQAYKKHSNTDDFYLAGVGTRLKVIGKIFGGVFGLGELPRINLAAVEWTRAQLRTELPGSEVIVPTPGVELDL